MDDDKKLEAIRRKTRQRLIFTGITLVLYFSYVFNYTTDNPLLGRLVGDSHISGSLVMFVCLIVSFIGLELLFLAINRHRGED